MSQSIPGKPVFPHCLDFHAEERIDAKAEAPILWPPDTKDQHIGKDPDAGKDCGQEEKGAIEDEMVEWHH